MGFEFPSRIKSYQIPAMVMFNQAQSGTSTWEEAAYACRLYDLPDVADYCDTQVGKSSVLPMPDQDIPCPLCGMRGLHRKGCKALAMQIKKNLPKSPNIIRVLFSGE